MNYNQLSQLYAYRNVPVRENLSLKVDDIPGARPKFNRATKNTQQYRDKLNPQYMEIRGGNLVYAPLCDTRNVVESFGYINPNKPKSQKKHYGFHLFSEITSSKLLQGTHKKDKKLEAFDFPRSLITYDIPGALPGTKRTKGVKNFEQAYRLRTENPPVQRQNNHYQYFPNQFRNKEHRNSDAHNNSVNLEGQYYGRGQSQGYEKRFVPRQHLWNGSMNPANSVNANNNNNIPQVSGYNNNLFGKDDLFTPEKERMYLPSLNPPRSRSGDNYAALRKSTEQNNTSLLSRPICNDEERGANTRLNKSSQAIRTPWNNSTRIKTPVRDYVEETTPRMAQSKSPRPSGQPQMRFETEPTYEKDFRNFYKNLARNHYDSLDKHRIEHENSRTSYNESRELPREVMQPPQQQTQRRNERNEITITDQSVERSLTPRPVHQENIRPISSINMKDQSYRRPRSRLNESLEQKDIIRHDFSAEKSPPQLKKVYVFDIVSNQPTLKLVPSNSRLPSRYGITIKEDVNEKSQRGATPNQINPRERVVDHRRNHSNPIETARGVPREDYQRANDNKDHL